MDVGFRTKHQTRKNFMSRQTVDQSIKIDIKAYIFLALKHNYRKLMLQKLHVYTEYKLYYHILACFYCFMSAFNILYQGILRYSANPRTQLTIASITSLASPVTLEIRSSKTIKGSKVHNHLQQIIVECTTREFGTFSA